VAGLGFFAPLPIALFIPFMASQSLAMGEAFGSGFQYGKRRISAMSNEKFNKLTPKQLHIDMSADIKSMIPSMIKSMDNFATLQPVIIKELLKYAFELAPVAADVIQEKLSSGELLENIKILSPALNQVELLDAIGNVIQNAILPSASAVSTGTGPVGPVIGVNQTVGPVKNPYSVGSTAYERYEAQVKLAIAEKTVRPTPGTIGPFAQEPTSSANLSLIAAGLRPDLRKPAPPKYKVPKSVFIKIKKFEQEILALTHLATKLRGAREKAKAIYNLRQAKLKLIALKKRYGIT